MRSTHNCTPPTFVWLGSDTSTAPKSGASIEIVSLIQGRLTKSFSNNATFYYNP